MQKLIGRDSAKIFRVHECYLQCYLCMEGERERERKKQSVNSWEGGGKGEREGMNIYTRSSEKENVLFISRVTKAHTQSLSGPVYLDVLFPFLPEPFSFLFYFLPLVFDDFVFFFLFFFLYFSEILRQILRYPQA